MNRGRKFQKHTIARSIRRVFKWGHSVEKLRIREPHKRGERLKKRKVTNCRKEGTGRKTSKERKKDLKNRAQHSSMGGGR